MYLMYSRIKLGYLLRAWTQNPHIVKSIQHSISSVCILKILGLEIECMFAFAIQELLYLRETTLDG